MTREEYMIRHRKEQLAALLMSLVDRKIVVVEAHRGGKIKTTAIEEVREVGPRGEDGMIDARKDSFWLATTDMTYFDMTVENTREIIPGILFTDFAQKEGSLLKHRTFHYPSC